MIFDQGPEPAPVNLVEIIHENAAVGITHLQGRDAQSLIADPKRIVNHPIHWFAGQHRNRRAVELWLTEFRLKQESAVAQSLSQKISFYAVARLQAQQLFRPQLVKK